MGLKIGIDVGGTFTDFLVAWQDREPEIFKVLSVSDDPSAAVINGLTEIASKQEPSLGLSEFLQRVETIVHGTTVTTNATLTRNGAKSGLITTEGVRDALEMRRGIREEQYNNRYTNVKPLVPRYLRAGVKGRLRRDGSEVEALSLDDVEKAIELFLTEGVEAVSICFMNAFINADHEHRAAELVRERMPDAYLTVSTDLLPSIRFYQRTSTTVLNSYIGPILNDYLEQLTGRLGRNGFNGLLMIMQSNGGVMTPETARKTAALTLLSGPAAGPGAGLVYAQAHDQQNCIVVDMGGTSFEAALVTGSPVLVNEGVIDRHRIALPMLAIHTIGAGGGSIGWIDEGGLLRMGPQSAGAVPGPVSYAQGGRLPACTDANLVLGYLNPDFFAGGSMKLDIEAARAAIKEHIAKPLGMDVESAAAGMYRVACNNMAQGVREVTIKRGFDPREFPMVVAGGAGPIHSCMICEELQIPFQIVPRESSILCAVGMLMGDLKHDFVRTFFARMEGLDWPALQTLVTNMVDEGTAMLINEGISQERQQFQVKLDCRYQKQYHEVSVEVEREWIEKADSDAIHSAFHAEHNRLYGYSLEDQQVSVDLINVRLQAIGVTDKPDFREQDYAGQDASAAFKGERDMYIFSKKAFFPVPVYDGHKMHFGNFVRGPAMIEQVTTAILVSDAYDCVLDQYGSFVVYEKGREDLLSPKLSGDQQ